VVVEVERGGVFKVLENCKCASNGGGRARGKLAERKVSRLSAR
jgi:hypothetical protein